MKRICLIVLAFVLFSPEIVLAQTATYTFVGTNSTSYPYPFINATYNRRQDLYLPSDFSPTIQGGVISKIYFKANESTTSVFTNLEIKMGQTTMTTLPSGSWVTAGMITVFSGNATLVNLPDNWREITLTTPFVYDNQENLIIDASQTGYNPGFNVIMTSANVTGRSLYGQKTVATAAYTQNYLSHMKLFFSTLYPPCAQPSNFSTSYVLAPNARINFDRAPGAQAYEYVLDQSPTNPSGNPLPLNDTFVNLTGLQPNSSYYLHVRTQCSLNKSPYVHYQFNTTCPAQAVTITPAAPVEICPGATSTLTGNPGGGVWSSANTTIAGIHNTTGVITAYTSGAVNLVYTYDSGACLYTQTKAINVLNRPAYPGPLTGVNNICEGALSQLGAPVPGGIWGIDNPSVATISNTGVVSSVAQGTATVSYTVGNAFGCTNTATSQITINPTPLLAGGIFGDTVLCAGESTLLRHATLGGTWTSVNQNVATIDNLSGIVTSLNAGTSNIRYSITVNGCSRETGRLLVVNALPVPVIQQVGNTLNAGATYVDYLWNRNGTPISGATTPGYTPAEDGDYTLSVTDANGCIGTSAPITITGLGLGISTKTADAGVTIFPNPANKFLKVSAKSDVNLVLLSLEGRTAMTQHIAAGSTVRIDISKLAAGMYFVEVMDNSGRKVAKEKLIIQP